MEALPEEIWITIFQVGVREQILYLRDLYSISLTCKLFSRIWSEDSIWSLLLALDFRQHETLIPQPDSPPCHQTLYKYRLGRLIKGKYAYIETKVTTFEDRIVDCSEWVNHIQQKLWKTKAYSGRRCIYDRIGMRRHRLEKLAELLDSGMNKGDEVTALCRQASFALSTLSATAPSSTALVDCSSAIHSLVDFENKMNEVLSEMRDKISSYYRKKDVFCTLLRSQLENFEQLVVLTSRLASLSSGSNRIETGGFEDAVPDYYSIDDDYDDINDDIHYDFDFCLDISDDDENEIDRCADHDDNDEDSDDYSIYDDDCSMYDDEDDDSDDNNDDDENEETEDGDDEDEETEDTENEDEETEDGDDEDEETEDSEDVDKNNNGNDEMKGIENNKGYNDNSGKENDDGDVMTIR